MLLRLNQGDPGEARVYYLPHHLAQRAGYFDDEALTVEMCRAEAGGRTVAGGQTPAVLNGTADRAIGGPMVTMKLAEEGTRLTNFCAAVRTNPWFVLGRGPEAGFDLTRLAGQRVIDIANVGTAGFIFDAVMAGQGIAAIRVPAPEGGIAAFLASDCDYAIHHLHAAAPAIAEGRIAALASLAGPTGGVPWSAYIARPEVIAANPAPIAAFRRAIGRALQRVATVPAGEIAALIAPHYPDHGPEALETAIRLYHAADLWPADPVIPCDDVARFGALLVVAGCLTRMPDCAALTGDGWRWQ